MGKIVMSEKVSLDGVIQDPAGDEGFRVGGWVGEIKGREEVGKVLLDEARGAEALLLGRRSYEFFAARWQPRRQPACPHRTRCTPESPTPHESGPGGTRSCALTTRRTPAQRLERRPAGQRSRPRHPGARTAHGGSDPARCKAQQ